MKLIGAKNQAWVTAALSDEDAKQAIILACSLKRVVSSRFVVILVSMKITPMIRERLHYEFDHIFMLEEDRNTANLNPDEFAKLSALSLKGFEKCVFLSPGMMVLKNCDIIFGQVKNANFACLEDDHSLSTFLYKPSMNSYNVLMNALRSRNRIPALNYIKNWFRNQYSDQEYFVLEPKFCVNISLKTEIKQNPSETDAMIVHFLDNPKSLQDCWKECPNTCAGLVEDHAIKTWLKYENACFGKVDDIASFTQGVTDCPKSPNYPKEPIAIIGMSCRFPGSNNLEEFWNLLINGEDGTGNPPLFRWLREQSSINRPDCRKTNAGFLKVPVDEFDAKFFGISNLDSLFMDPQIRILHEIVFEALEDSGIDYSKLRGTNGGVFVGEWTNDYVDILKHSKVSEFYRSYMGNSIAAAAARISFLLGMTGPSIATESGCSSAMVAVHMACKSLEREECGVALACGVNLLLHPFDQDVMPMVISPEGRCKTFSDTADGFARGEGCAVLVLKRLSDAVKDKDNIWALIRGSGVSQEGISRSMGTPTVVGEAMAMTQAMQDAHVLPEEVSYLEAHGTGTVVGDPLEISAIAKAYHSKARKEPLIVGSVKTNVGHTESCSGITGIIKVALAMRHEVIPPHRNFERLNPSINLDAVPAIIPLKSINWAKYKDERRRIAGVSSFGITGTDAHAILEEPPEIPDISLMSNLERPQHLLKITAKTEEALDKLLEKYVKHLENTLDDIADIAYTANIGRANFPWRAVVFGRSKQEFVAKIQQNQILKQEVSMEEIGKICFLFTGQGSQHQGMAKHLYHTSAIFKTHFDYCEEILRKNYNINVRKVIWEESGRGQVSQTIYSQTSIFCVEYALLKLLESWGIKPDYVLGHSLGEFCAATCAGILSVEDAITLVAERSILINKLQEGKMLAIKADKVIVGEVMKKFADGNPSKMLDYAAVNSKQQTVVAGDCEVILLFAKYCQEIMKMKSVILDATHAFHSKHMDSILEGYRNTTGGIRRTKKREIEKCGYISGMMGRLLQRDSVDAEYWVQHTRQPVNFLDASKTAVELGCQIFIEVGPQPVLSALTMMNNEDVKNLSCFPTLKRNESEWDTVLGTLGKLYMEGVTIDWQGFDALYKRKKVRLPHYPFIGKKYWPDLMATSDNTIHPLVGSFMANASPTKIFQNGLNTRCLEYVKDHVIGQNVIFPGAGYLEMALAAGHAVVESCTDFWTRPIRPMKVEELRILAPLVLEESKTCQVQVVVDFKNTSNENGFSDWDHLSIKIFQRLDSKWLTHSTARFTPFPPAEEATKAQKRFDLEVFHKLRCQTSDDKMIGHVYDKLASVGLKFGPIFQSIDKIWRDETGNEVVAKVKIPPLHGDSQQYIIHPVVLDSMIQTVMLFRNFDRERKKRLSVPIAISKFLWLQSAQGEELYVHTVKTHENEKNEAVLVDELGNVICVMSGIELIDTTVKAVESILEQQRSTMPDMWEEIWRSSKRGPMLDRIPDNIISQPWDTPKFRKYMEETYNTPLEETEAIFRDLEEYVYHWILNGLYECGWEPQVGQKFSTKSLLERLKIEGAHKKLVNWFMEVLQQYGIVKSEILDGQVSWNITAILAEPEAVKLSLALPIFEDDLVQKFGSTRLVKKLGENLSTILQGHQSSLKILFPEDSKNDPSVLDFYLDYGQVFNIFGAFRDAQRERLSFWLSRTNNGEKFVYKVLEVGGGTGFFTSHILPVIEEFGIEFEYVYTDISPGFFSSAEKKFEKYKSSLRFKKLNIEEDPISQGFPPNYYDHVIASDVVHATKDVYQTLMNIRKLVREGGNLDIFEQIQRNRLITFIFGMTDGFWRMTDFRKDHCTITDTEWVLSLEKTGFGQVVTFPCLNGRHALISSYASNHGSLHELSLEQSSAPTWLIFTTRGSQFSQFITGQLEKIDRKTTIVEAGGNFQELFPRLFQLRGDQKQDFDQLMSTLLARAVKVEGIIYLWGLDKNRTSQEEILQPYFYIAQTIFSLKQKVPPRLFAVTQGAVPIGDTDLSHFHLSTLWGFTKSFANENTDIICRCINVANEMEQMSEREMNEVFHEIWNDDKELQVAYYKGNRHVPRFQPLKVVSKELSPPLGTSRFKLVLPDTKAIDDLQFGPLDHFVLEENEIEIQVKASALNFRDVLTVLKPTEEFKNFNSVGFDFAGVVKSKGSKVTKWGIGDPVFGVNLHGDPLPSHLKTNENDVLQVPDLMTFCEAATLPAVVTTSYHCLIDIAKIKSTDIVLIHTASGGVGLSAIDICKSFGCKIIATAGSKRKQNYLRSLGIQHIFHSRNTDYSEEILKVTNGHGVDVVLNSLTSEGFKEATLRACASGARFVEMSKLNIWTSQEVYDMRPDIEYTVVDISTSKPEEWRRLLEHLNELSEQKVIRPIPYVRFDALNIRDALGYLQKAKHVGKVVCVMPEFGVQSGEYKVVTPLFNDRSTYLITGGLGGIGFEVCKWMVQKNGAKHVILASRRNPSEAKQEEIDHLNSEGANVIPVRLDVGDYLQCKDIFDKIKSPTSDLPPVRGILHAAGILNDGLVTNMDWTKLSSTFNAKVKGTLNLHQLSLGYPLEHFVLFSSVVSLFGSPGQCNHSAGNNFEDTFAHYRNSMGLCATTINWGQWGETGVAVDVELPGLKALSTLQGISALEHLMKTQRLQTCVMNVDSFLMLSKFAPQTSTYLDERIWKASSGSNSTSKVVKSDEFWQLYDSKEDKLEKLSLIKCQLKDMLRKILKLDSNDPVEGDANFQEMGVDSLMFIEIKNAVQSLLGDRVTVSTSSLRDCATINSLAEQLMRLAEGEESINLSEAPPSFEDVNELIMEDCILPEKITGVGRPFKNVSGISTVLITGVTGTLGPYILKELSQVTQISEIFCLIRPSKSQDITQRLIEVLEFRDLLQSVDMSKVKCIPGNVSKSNLGMQPIDWDNLVEKVDAVFHLAAKADHTQYYRKRDPNVEDVRSVNVCGTKNILQFACANEHHVKHIFFSSSLLSVATTDEDGCLSENWPQLKDFDGVTKFAYPISKFVGDLLMKIASLERGVPVKVFRLPLVAGDSKTGKFNVDQNHMMLRYLFIMKCGIMPSNPFPMVILPVDMCASVSVKLFFYPGLSSQHSDIYNITHPRPDLDQEFPSISEGFGYYVKIVEFSEFAQKLSIEPETSAFSMFKEFYRNEDELMSVYTFVSALRKWLEGVENFWVSKKLMASYPQFYDGLERTIQSLERDLQFAKREGLFEKFGLIKK